MDDDQLMMVSHDIWRKSLVKNHDVRFVGDVGMNRIVDLVKRAHWWHGLWGDVTIYVQSLVNLTLTNKR